MSVKTAEIWKNIHAERAALVDTLASMNTDQWNTMSWCDGWSVHKLTGHVVAASEQTFANFYKELASAGFSFDRFTDRGAQKVAAAPSEELVTRLRARLTTTNRPPAPVMAMLGEIVVHGDDIRRPLGLVHRSPEAALIAVADSWKNSNLLIGAKRRIAGVALRATDAPGSHGDGPAVQGSLQSLILAMTGRKGAHVDLSGEGLALLASRP
jgi:uncharacterized protein (TIGR03083 family)